MKLWRFVIREILHRRLVFGLGVLSVLIAVGILVAQVTLLREHDRRTREILDAAQRKAAVRLGALEDDYRKIMKQLGFNLLILPEGQQLADFWAAGYAAKTMSEALVGRLANSGTMRVRHLLPMLERKVFWPERKRTIVLIGVRGEVPLPHRDPKKPLQAAVAPGKIVVGHALAQDLSLAPGQSLVLLGRRFTIDKVHAERGTKDDITVWIDLAAAQQLLDAPGRINAIRALKCFCYDSDIGAVRKEIARTLPGTRVLEMDTLVTVRARARARARQEHQAAMAQLRVGRAELRAQREAFAALLVPLVLAGAAAWIALLALLDARRRRAEIGLLRAIGLRSGQIFAIFLAKAALTGLIGAAAGTIAGLLAAGFQQGIDPILLPAVLVGAPLLAAAAGWVPAMIAARQDPATVLREE